MFIDADDYLVPGGIGRLIEIAENNQADVVSYRIISVSNDSPIDTESISNYQCSIKTVVGAGEALMRYDVPDFHVVNSLFRSSIIKENRVRFCRQLSIREDDVFCGMLYCHTRTIVVTDLPLYRYVRSSFYSSTHNLSKEVQRKLITSSYLAMNLRGDYVSKFFPDAMQYERLKYMRWVCHPKTAFYAGYSLSDYSGLLSDYKKIGCWPLDYKWIQAAGLDKPIRLGLKNRIKTFLCNHPAIAFSFLKIKKK